MQSRNLTILLILLIASCYSLWIKPQTELLAGKKTELAELQSQIDSINGQRLNVENQSNTSDLEQALLQEAVPQGFDQDTLIKTLKNIASEYQINLVNISFNQSFAEQSNQIKSVQISMTANGDPSRVKAFLAALENSNRGFFVKNLGINYGTINDVSISNLNLNFEAYFS